MVNTPTGERGHKHPRDREGVPSLTLRVLWVQSNCVNPKEFLTIKTWPVAPAPVRWRTSQDWSPAFLLLKLGKTIRTSDTKSRKIVNFTASLSDFSPQRAARYQLQNRAVRPGLFAMRARFRARSAERKARRALPRAPAVLVDARNSHR